MKKPALILTVILTLALLTCFTACSDEKAADDGTLTIVTTIFPPYDFARQIASGTDGVEVKMLLPAGSESHDYEPSVSDIALVGRADLVICVGGETDSWIDGVIRASESCASVLRLLEAVELLEEDEAVLVTSDASHGHSHEHSHEHGEDCTYDEHVWTSPENAALITEKIAEKMGDLAEDKRDLFESNAARYAKSLREVQKKMNALSTKNPEALLLFADRFPFRYLSHSMGVECRAAFSGCSSDSEASLEAVYRICELVKGEEAPVIFTCEFSSQNAARIISRETGCRIRELHSCHNVSKEDFDNGITCLALMERNLTYLSEALTVN